jgi:hypothetical protein
LEGAIDELKSKPLLFYDLLSLFCLLFSYSGGITGAGFFGDSALFSSFTLDYFMGTGAMIIELETAESLSDEESLLDFSTIYDFAGDGLLGAGRTGEGSFFTGSGFLEAAEVTEGLRTEAVVEA